MVSRKMNLTTIYKLFTITRVKYSQNRHFQDDNICLSVSNHAHVQTFFCGRVNAPQSLQAAEPNVYLYERWFYSIDGRIRI